MTAAAQRYATLEQQVLLGRAMGTLPEAEEDRLLEEMDDLWWQMAEAEREEANQRAAESAELEAPADLGLEDNAVERGSQQHPRKVA